jgi:hypothetical protein
MNEKIRREKEILTAYFEGKTIEYELKVPVLDSVMDKYKEYSTLKQVGTENVWIEVDSLQFLICKLNYGAKIRIKPETKYIPFTYEDANIFANKEVFCKETNRYCIIIFWNFNGIEYVNGNEHIFYPFDIAFRELNFKDGSIFGKRVD